MCVHRKDAQSLLFSSIYEEEECPEGATRYIVVFARKPRGAMGMVKSTTSKQFYPPLTLNWPPSDLYSRNALWHFTCVTAEVLEVFDANVQLFKYRGEITSDGKAPCWEAEQRALQYCQETLKGGELLENCAIGWGI